MSGPTIYAKVESNRVDELDEIVTRFRERIVDEVRSLRIDSIQQALREAYRRGVIDGYLQGSAEATERAVTDEQANQKRQP